MAVSEPFPWDSIQVSVNCACCWSTPLPWNIALQYRTKKLEKDRTALKGNNQLLTYKINNAGELPNLLNELKDSGMASIEVDTLKLRSLTELYQHVCGNEHEGAEFTEVEEAWTQGAFDCLSSFSVDISDPWILISARFHHFTARLPSLCTVYSLVRCTETTNISYWHCPLES